MGKLSLNELTSTKLSKNLVDTLSAIQGGTEEYCHNGYTKGSGCDRLTCSGSTFNGY